MSSGWGAPGIGTGATVNRSENGLTVAVSFSTQQRVGYEDLSEEWGVGSILAGKGTSFSVSITPGPIPGSWAEGSYLESSKIEVNIEGQDHAGHADYTFGSAGEFVFNPTMIYQFSSSIIGTAIYKRYYPPANGQEAYYQTYSIGTGFDLERPGVFLELTNPGGTAIPWMLDINGVLADRLAEDDVFERTYDVAVQYFALQEEEWILQPSPNVSVRVAYYGFGGPAADHYLYSDEGVTDAAGHTLVSFGAGGMPTVPIPTQFFGPSLYVKAEPLDKTGTAASHAYLTKQLDLPALATFEGPLNFKVTDPDGNPLRAKITIWGGKNLEQEGKTAVTDATGRAEIPCGYSGSTAHELAIHLAPQAGLSLVPVQHIESPPQQVAHTPVYLMVKYQLDENAYSYETSGASKVGRLIVKNDGGGVLHQENGVQLRHPAKLNAAQLKRGENRIYLDAQASEELNFYDAKIEFDDTDSGAPEPVMTAAQSGQARVQINAEPSQDKFHVEFVVCRVGAWASAATRLPGSYFLPDTTKSEQIAFMQQFFPMKVTHSVNSNWAPMSGADETFSFNSTHLHNLCVELERYRLMSKGTDFVVGVVPPGYLHTHSLFSEGGAVGLEFDDCPTAVLIDATQVREHTTLHEYTHTLGLGDVGEPGDEPPATDGYDHKGQAPLINVEGVSSYPQYQDLMYDHAMSPWLTVSGYTALLSHNTHPLGGKPLSGEPKDASGPGLNMLISGEITGTTAAPGLRLDPVLEDAIDAWRPVTVPKNGDLYMRFLDAGEAELDRAYFRPARLISDPAQTGWDEGRVTSFVMALPRPEGLKKIVVGPTNHVGGIVGIWAELDMSGQPPAAAWVGPAAGALGGTATLTWSASDSDSWTLHAAVLFSPDNGASWQTVTSGVEFVAGTEATLVVDAASLPSTAQGRFKVLVSDGTHGAVPLLSPVYAISNPPAAPVAEPVASPVTILTSGTLQCTIPIPIRNSGDAPLSVALTAGSLPPWLARLTRMRTLEIEPGCTEILPLVIDLKTTTGGATAQVAITTNDSAHPAFTLPISITQDHAAHAPRLLRVAAVPASAIERPLSSGGLKLRAWTVGGGASLDARLTITELNTNAEPFKLVPLEALQTQPGCYEWGLENVRSHLPNGRYGITVTLRDPATGLASAHGPAWPDPDLTFTVVDSTTLPVFSQPAAELTELTVRAGEEIELPYAVSSPIGGRLDLALAGTPYLPALLWDKPAGKLRWRPDVAQYNTWDIYLMARNEQQAMRTIRWRVTVLAPLGVGTEERAWNSSTSVHDGSVLSGPEVLLTAQTQTPGQQGAIFQWRAVGATTWNSSPLIAYENPFWDLRWASWSWDVSALPPATQYELRTVNVNAAGQQDPNAPIIRLWSAGLAGNLTRAEAPHAVRAGESFRVKLWAQNQGGPTWTAQNGPTAAPASGSAFSLISGGSLATWMQVPPGSASPFLLELTAPAAPGDYSLSLELKGGANRLGAALTVPIRVAAPSHVTQAQLRAYLLGSWQVDPAWRNEADMNGDGTVDISDLVMTLLVGE